MEGTKRVTRVEYFRNRRKELKKTQEDVKNLNGELFFLCREQMVEIGSQRLLANGWTTYSLGDTEAVRALQADARKAHQQDLTKFKTSYGSTNGSTISFSQTGAVVGSDTKETQNQYSHHAHSDQRIDSVLKVDGFVPRLLQRYFELTATGLGREGVQNRSSATCCHGPHHETCSLDNVFPLYCIVLLHLEPGAGPMIYPRHRLGRSLSISRAEMLSTQWNDTPLPVHIAQQLRDRFGFILQSEPKDLIAEMDGPGIREVGDVTIIASDMLYAMPTFSNLSYPMPKYQFAQASADPILPSAKRKKYDSEGLNMGETANFITRPVSSYSCGSSSSSAPPPVSLSVPPSTLYAYTVYQPKIEASFPPNYIPNSESTSKIRFDPSKLLKVISTGDGTLPTSWASYNEE